MKISHLILLVGLSLSQTILSNVNLVSHKSDSLNTKMALKAEYFGELLLHPGVSIGIEYTLLERKNLNIHWDNEFGGYWHRWNNSSLFLKTSVGARYYIKSNFVDIKAGIGYLHNWVSGPLYGFNSEKKVTKIANLGRAQFMPHLSLAFGLDNFKRNNKPWLFHFGPEIYWQYPTNHIFIPHVAFKVGFTYKLNQK